MADMVIWLLNILLADSGNIYNVGSSETVTILDLAVMITSKMAHDNVWIDYSKFDPRPNYVPNLQFAREDLGLRVYTDLDTALDKTIEWERK